MKRYLFVLISIFFVFSSCAKQEEEYKVYPAKEYIVASERGCCPYEGDGWLPYFFVKEKGSNTWKEYDRIVGFDNYEPGYEYRIKVIPNVLYDTRDNYEWRYILYRYLSSIFLKL